MFEQVRRISLFYHDPRQEPREDPGILARKRHWEGNCTRAPPNLVANLQKVQNKNQIYKINPTAPPSASYVAYLVPLMRLTEQITYTTYKALNRSYEALG